MSHPLLTGPIPAPTEEEQDALEARFKDAVGDGIDWVGVWGDTVCLDGHYEAGELRRIADALETASGARGPSKPDYICDCRERRPYGDPCLCFPATQEQGGPALAGSAAVGTTLRCWRESYGQTQREAAAEADVDPTYISKVENGHMEPSLRLLERLGFQYDRTTVEVTALCLRAGHVPDWMPGVILRCPNLVADLCEMDRQQKAKAGPAWGAGNAVGQIRPTVRDYA